MGFIEKLADRLGFQPKPAIKPARRSFGAAKTNRLTHSWKSVLTSVDQDILRSLRTLRGRSRQLCYDNDYAKRFIQISKTNIIGPKGIMLQSRVENESGELDTEANELIESAFRSWGKKGSCDVTGQLSWVDVQNLFVESVLRDGECLIRKVKGFPHNPFAFALQVIEADHLDETLNKDLRNGHKIRMGVEFDEWERPVNYWIRRKHPGDHSFGAFTGESQFDVIPATDMVHGFIPFRARQSRGVPAMHTAMFRLNMLGGYEEAELVAARLGAAKMGFFERAEDGMGYEGEIDDDELVMEAEPGVFEQLPPGVKVTSWDPQHPGGNFQPFLKAMLRGAASGLNISYNTLANDLEHVNYSSIRSGVLEDREAWKGLQYWVIESLHSSVFPDWLEMAILAQQIPFRMRDFDRLNRPSWQPRRWTWVDPLKEVKAALVEVQMGAKSLDELIRESGRDPEEVFKSIAKTKKRLQEYGLEEVLNFIYEGKEENETVQNPRESEE